MTFEYTTRGGACAVALGLTSGLFAHVDDPKVRDWEPPFQGPGWRASQDAPPPGFPAQDVELLSWLTVPEFSPSASGGNDCWGYVSPSGNEYAIMCVSNATGFVDITDPTNPIIVETISSPECLWHDVKVFEDFAYVVSECGAGVQVIDMSQIDAGIVTHVRDVTSGGSNSHNIVINEDSGYLYRAGGSGNGFLIYDLNASKSNPPLVATWPDRYVHDAQVVSFTTGPYAGREIAYICGGDRFEILDVTSKAGMFTTDSYNYPSDAYVHQGWLTADRSLMYVNDEADEQSFGVNTTTHLLDVSDITNVTQLSTFTAGVPAIDHNLYVRSSDNLIFEANYRSGLRVFDNTDPLNPTQAGYFDTYPANDNANFSGAWSCFPFFPSGNVIISDTVNGMFVVKFQRALLTIDFPNGLPGNVDPNGGETVEVRIVELSKGGLEPGTEQFHYDAGAGYVSTPLVNIGDGLYEATFPAVPCGTEIAYYFSAEQTDGGVITSPSGAPGNSYGTVSADGEVVVLTDNAETDPGWTVNTAGGAAGGWDRGVPVTDGSRGAPTMDADGSGSAWVTGNEQNEDVDGGPVEIISPAYDLSAAVAPFISYARWFTTSGGDSDVLDVYVSNDDGANWTLVETVGGTSGWETHTFGLAGVVAPTSQVRLRFETADNPNNSVTEAGVDAIEIRDVTCPAPCPSDIDGNGSVGIGDLLAILSAWGNPGGPEDLDESGNVDFGDILVVLGDWGTVCP